MIQVQEFIPSQFIFIPSLSRKIGQDNTRFTCTSFSREKIFSLQFHTDIKDHKSTHISGSCIQLVIADFKKLVESFRKMLHNVCERNNANRDLLQVCK